MGHLNICNTFHIHPHIQIRGLVSHLSQNIHKPANKPGEQSFQSIFLVTLIKTKFQGNANNTWEKAFKKVSATVHHKANIYLSTKNSYIFNVNKHV